VNSWYHRDVASVAAQLGVVTSQGLASTVAAERLTTVGPNRLAESSRKSSWRMLADQFTDVMVLVLVAAAVVAGIVGEPQDTITIAAILVLNATLGFVQEYRAERAVAALRALAASAARVRRDGSVKMVAAPELVPGDIVLVEAGVIVPADLRLVATTQLRVNESALTGESQPVDKVTAAIAEERASLGDRVNMAFKGTVATHGRGEGIVVATGMRTELGRVARLLEAVEDTRTPLQRRLERFASQLAVIVLVLCAVIFGIGLLRGEPPLLMFLTALSLAVAAMPEALPAVVTVSLALGARRLVARNALIRHLPAVETLGSVTFICSDKTGTLTQNRMGVEAVRSPPFGATDSGSRAPDAGLLRAMVLNSDAVAAADGRVEGDPTEAAILRHARDALGDVAATVLRHPRLDEIPFSAERGRMSTLHEEAGERAFLVVKGAPERVLGLCAFEVRDGAAVPLDREAALSAAHDMASAGLRVLAFAVRHDVAEEPGGLSVASEAELTLLGFVGLLDPPRPEAAEAVAQCVSAGIRVVLVTGDHPATAGAIARQLAIATPHAPDALTGVTLEQLDDETLRDRAGELRVYARVAPEQKIRIVKALQARGEIVAMTGDGVNDAPALRQADIGIAMGRSGTDVAREAADLILVDDNFASIVAAVREGRHIYDNIRKFIRYILTGNSAEIWLLFLAPWFGLPLPLLPIHILWINLVTDGLPGLALALEPAERDIMRRPPRAPNESVFAHGLWQHALWVGLLMGVVSLLTQGWAIHSGLRSWQSMTFTVLVLSQLGHVMAVRSERDSLATQGLWSNRVLTLAIAGTVGLQLATLYVPVLNRIFKTVPLTASELGLCLALSSVVFLAVEWEKSMLRRGFRYAGWRGASR
jgi:Ca2+-transporting ATPase